jgi:hypothetical protein
MSPAFRRLWGWPIALGVASAVGLLSALVGDDGYDAVSWAGLGLPLVVAVGHLRRR